MFSGRTGWMISLTITLFAILPASAQQLEITGPDTQQMIEGHRYLITWNSSQIERITIMAQGHLISLPDKDRGQFQIPIAERIPANFNQIPWDMPYLDTRIFHLVITGYDSSGNPIASNKRLYQFRPAILANRTRDGIYVDLRSPDRQRLYVMKDHQITHAYLTSGGRSGHFYPLNVHPKTGHDHAGVFRVIDKERSHWSALYHVTMVYSMRFLGGHYIHGTLPDQYFRLGRAASSGCVRLHRTDAKELYAITPVGTRVEIFGPDSKKA